MPGQSDVIRGDNEVFGLSWIGRPIVEDDGNARFVGRFNHGDDSLGILGSYDDAVHFSGDEVFDLLKLTVGISVGDSLEHADVILLADFFEAVKARDPAFGALMQPLQILDDLAKYNFVPYTGKLAGPTWLDDPSEVISKGQGRNTDELVTIHQFAFSARVVDTKEWKTVWYGYAESQNLTYINAVKECCEAMVESLVSKATADSR